MKTSWAFPTLMLLLAAGLTVPAAAQDTASVEPGLIPAGYGTLRQDDIAVQIQTATFAIRLLPLDEGVIRLLAPDSYRSLAHLKRTRAGEISSAASRAAIAEPMLFLVVFFGLQHEARFTPEDLTITSRNRVFRPAAILPMSPRWSELLLRQRETATAIYLYEDSIALFEPLTVQYGGIVSNQWGRTLSRLDRERAAVLSRAGLRGQ